MESSKIQARVRDILRRTPVGQLLRGEDLELALMLLNRHPHRAEKMGVGVRGISVGVQLDSRCLEIVRVDGTREHFSYLKCLRRWTEREEILRVLRTATQGDTRAFKISCWFEGYRCPLTGRTLTWEDAEVDHAYPSFGDLVDAWVGSWGGFGPRVLSADALGDWTAYHGRRARLRLISGEVNRGQLRRDPGWMGRWCAACNAGTTGDWECGGCGGALWLG